MKSSRTASGMATLLIVIVVLVCAPSAKSQQQLDIAVDIAPLPQPNWPVELKRIELRGDDLLLQLQNRTRKPVVAVYVEYDFNAPAACGGEPTVHNSALASGDAQRVPGMTSVDIEPNGIIWYTHQHMASNLALAAVRDSKSRYVRVHAKVRSVAFADGSKTDPLVWAAKDWPEPKESDAANCAKRPWDDSLGSIRGFMGQGQYKSARAETPLVTDQNASGEFFVCNVVNDYVVCPKQ